nr:MAG: hypothetical protein [Microvirus sp.]
MTAPSRAPAPSPLASPLAFSRSAFKSDPPRAKTATIKKPREDLRVDFRKEHAVRNEAARASIASAPQEKERKRTWRDPVLTTKPEPALRSDERMRDPVKCKDRPRKNSGGGGSKRFIPWCR